VHPRRGGAVRIKGQGQEHPFWNCERASFRPLPGGSDPSATTQPPPGA
jgi:hypothetical protein